MSPVNPHIPSQLRQLIYYNLDCNLLKNALFLAGRLHAYEPKASEAAYLLAYCNLRLGQLKTAYDYSKNYGARGTHLGCSYVFAQACLGLETYNEGIMALDRSRGLWAARNNWNKHTDTRRQHLPDAAAVLCLQGKLLQAYEDTNKAIDCYAEALKLNPFMWDAFLGLCDLGVNVRIPNIFKVTPEMLSVLASSSSEDISTGESPPNSLPPAQPSQPPQASDPFTISTNRVNGEGRSNISKAALFEKFNGSSTNLVTPIGSGVQEPEITETPTAAAAPQASRARESVSNYGEVSTTSSRPPPAPMRKARAIAGLTDFSVDAPPKMKSSHLRIKSRSKEELEDRDSLGSNLSSGLGTRIADRKRTVSGQVAPVSSSNHATLLNESISDPIGPQRRSVRLFNQIRPQRDKFSSSVSSISLKEGREIKKARATGPKGRSGLGTVGRVVSGNRNHGDPMDIDAKEPRITVTSGHSTHALFNSRSIATDKGKDFEALQYILDLFSRLGGGYFALSHYQCDQAIQSFNGIVPSQRETPWVLAQIGRALYEKANYAESAKYFARIKTMAPSRLEDMEVYSTVLWQLKNEIDLAFVAHEVVDVDRNSPQAWCVVGNSFSLQRDHDQALKCFRRATQLDSKFAYAFTLQGHEHIANEEYDKAMSAYRSAIAAENRHYNAWYGLGKVYEKQGKYDVAEQHYLTAATINPTNAVLICCLGTVLEKMKKTNQALEKYTRSCELAPRSIMSRYKKARVLMALQMPEQALVELKVLKDIAPDESDVHFLLGRVYKILRHKASAIKHFTTALNLDPKASHHIKEAMEQIEEEGDEDGPM